MEHSWCSCSATAVARAAVLLLRSEPVMPLVRRSDIDPQLCLPERHYNAPLEAGEQQTGPLLYTRVRLPHPDNTGFPFMVHFSLPFRSPLLETQSALC